MALRLRRDVQKASYYVWFLGAEEARGLRGPRVINPVVPYLIERSRDQEPLKVTLQVSHKGIKILQGQSKHFIPHSAITSSVQIDDIVACVLLLYNPATKCPLHVHAYRCDSETTAEALHQQLQILINRPENQKRFADLESRLGITQNTLGSNTVEQKRFPPRRTESSSSSSPKRFESSLGSDTGTSTRESECSEENTSSSPMSPVHKQKGDLFDSLAAELRAKLNGNGPPLLLPPRDYDTVHRSKGNLAAIELRRCRNSLIVGATTGPAKQVSSRGSSGIGSDLAPSPERQDDHSSSEEDNWSNDAENSVAALKTNQVEPLIDKRRHEENYLRDLPVRDYPRSTSRGRESFKNNTQVWSVEDDIRPIIMRTPDYDARFKRVLVDKHYNDERITDMEEPAQVNRIEDEPIPQGRRFCKYPDETDHKKVDKLEKSLHSKLSLHQRQQYDRYDYDFDTEEEDFHQHENLTDRQKYQEAYSRKGKTRQIQSYERPKYLEEEGPIDTSTKLQRRYHFSPERQRQQQPHPHEVYRAPVQGGKDNLKYNEKNPYKKPDSLPYRESIERMMKSPVMRYKSFDNNQARPDYENNNVAPRPNFRNQSYSVQEKRSLGETDRYDGDSHFTNNKSQVNNSSPDSSNTSPKDRFHDAKEKFRAMEKIKLSTERNILKPHGPKELHRRGSLEPPDGVDVRYENNWSDEDQCVTNREQRGGIIRREYRKNEKRPEDVYPGISNSKSLSNLAKGYRHSYAEPRPSLPRNSGRVGLAAVNPF